MVKNKGKLKKNSLIHARRRKIIASVMVFFMAILCVSLIYAAWWIDVAPTHYYKLNEAGAGDVGLDTLSTTNLTVTGTCAVKTGKLGNARACDGVGNYLIGTNNVGTDFGTGDFTITFWFNISTTSDAWGGAIHNFGTDAWGAANRWAIAYSESGNGDVKYISSGSDIISYDGTLHDAAWHRVVLSRTGTGVGETKLYVDGLNVINGTDNNDLSEVGVIVLMEGATGYANAIRGNGPLDDLQIFKGYAWGDENVTTDWNSGDGQEADVSTFSITTTLLIPDDASTTKDSAVNFTGNFTPMGGNLTNATLFVWHNNKTLFGTNYTIVTGNSTNSTIASVSGLSNGDYAWNFYGCVKNDSASICDFAVANFTFTKTAFVVVSQSYFGSVYETSRQNYELNVTTISSILSISAKLVYNNTNYSATSTCVASACSIKSSLDVPLIPIGIQQNKSFWWELTVYDGTTSQVFDTTDYTKEQNVTAINLTFCAAAPYDTKALNFTAFHEQNLTRLPLYSYKGTFDFWLGGGSVKKRYAYSNLTANEINFCILPNLTFYTTAEMSYNFKDANTTLTQKTYYYNNFSLGARLNQVELFLLNAADSTSFILQVLRNNAGVLNALINIQRFYPEIGVWKTVQIARTNDNGGTIGNYQVEDTTYRHIIYDSTGALLLSTAEQKVYATSTPYTLTFDVGSAPEVPWGDFLNNTNFTTSLTWNNTNKMVAFTYIDLYGHYSGGNLVVELQRFSNISLLLCNVTSIQPSATLYCNLSAYDSGNFVARGYIYTATASQFTDLINFVISSASSIFDNTAVIMGWFIILTVAMIFLWNPSVDIIAVNIAVIFVNLIGLVSFGMTWIFGMIALSIIILILMKT